MNNFKKLIALIIAISLLSVPVYAEETTTETENMGDGSEEYTEDTGFQETEEIPVNIPKEDEQEIPKEQTEDISSLSEYALLESIGISLEKTPLDEKITRAKAAYYIALLSNSDVDTTDAQTYFYDVDLGNKYLRYINYCYMNGYLKGTGGQYFEPEREISAIEFATAILRVAGFNDFAQASGGYSISYMNLAYDYDLFDGVKTTVNTPLNQTDALIMMVNALNLPVCSMIAADGENLRFDISGGYTLLNKNFDIEKVRAVVCATENAALSAYAAENEGNIGIIADGEKKSCTCDIFETEKFLGQSVYCYINKNDEVVYIEPVIEADSIELDFDKITNVSQDRLKISYKNSSDRPQTAKLAYDTVFIWNGKQHNTVNTDEFTKPNTVTTLYDTDNDGTYELAFIERSEVLLVEEFADPIYSLGADIDIYENWGGENKTGYYIDPEKLPEGFNVYPEHVLDALRSSGISFGFGVVDKTMGKICYLDKNSEDYELQLIYNGYEIEFSDIRKYDLISVCESLDGKKRKVYVSREAVEGKVTAVDTENHQIAVEGTPYVYSFGDLKAAELLSKTVKIYLDYRGYAAAYRYSETAAPVYGYLMDYQKDSKALSDKAYAKVFTMEEKIEIFEVSENFRHNEVKSDFDTFTDYFNISGHQLVMYTLNSENQISKIYTSAAPEGYVLGGEKPIFVMNEHYNGDTGNYGKYQHKILEMEYSTRDTQRMVVVTDENGDILDERVYMTTTFKTRTTPDIKVYNARAGKIADFLVCTVTDENADDSVSLTDRFFVIGSIKGTSNGKRLEGMSYVSTTKPTLLYYYEGSDGMFDTLKRGDIIKINRVEKREEDGESVIRSFVKVFTLQSNGEEDMTKTICADYPYSKTDLPITEGRQTYNKQVYGTVKAIDSLDLNDNIDTYMNVVTIQPEGTTDEEDCYVITYEAYGHGREYLFCYNTAEKTLERYEPYRLQVGDKFFVATNYYQASFAVKYE